MTRVTILTVAFNSEATIKDTIESVLNQDYEELEYIIVDGESKDRTVEIASAYENAFVKKGYGFQILSEKDEGMYDALNKGVRIANGELIGSINADDWYEKSAVSTMVKAYEESPYDIAWGSINILKDSGNMVKHARFSKKIVTTAGFCHPAMFATRKTLLEIPYANLAMDDDFDFILRALKENKSIHTIDQVISNYRFGGMSTKKSFKGSMNRVKMKYKTYRRNGYSRFYWFYCLGIEMAKFILG